MATVIVHDVDEAALASWRESLAATGASVEAEVRSMIEGRAKLADADRQQRGAEAVAALRAHRAKMRAKYGPSVNLTALLLEERAEG